MPPNTPPSAPSDDERPRVTIAVPKGRLRTELARLLEARGVEVDLKAPGDPSEAPIEDRDSQLVLVRRADLSAEDRERLDAMATDPDAPHVVVLAEDVDEHTHTHLVASGASDVIDVGELNRGDAEILEALAGASEAHLTPDSGRSRGAPSLSDFASRSHAMQRMTDLVARVADTASPLLLTGETGVGKDHLARAIHAEGSRADAAFVAVNCGALPAELLESELFGHERGAFTGAQRTHRGCFERAHGGTLFLDEIGEMPPPLQVKLLGVLQHGRIRRLGSETEREVDVRTIAATNRDLRADIVEGRFREDLYYRLNVVTLEIPPLRERKEDLPTLIGSLVRHFRDRTGRDDVEGIASDALERLIQHDWPGNVRELVNVIERAMLVARGGQIERADLPVELAGDGPTETPSTDAASSAAPIGKALLDKPWKRVREETIRKTERDYLDGLLRRHEGRVGDTARAAGLAPRSLYEKMRRHGLRKEDYA